MLLATRKLAVAWPCLAVKVTTVHALRRSVRSQHLTSMPLTPQSKTTISQSPSSIEYTFRARSRCSHLYTRSVCDGQRPSLPPTVSARAPAGVSRRALLISIVISGRSVPHVRPMMLSSVLTRTCCYAYDRMTSVL